MKFAHRSALEGLTYILGSQKSACSPRQVEKLKVIGHWSNGLITAKQISHLDTHFPTCSSLVLKQVHMFVRLGDSRKNTAIASKAQTSPSAPLQSEANLASIISASAVTIPVHAFSLPINLLCRVPSATGTLWYFVGFVECPLRAHTFQTAISPEESADNRVSWGPADRALTG